MTTELPERSSASGFAIDGRFTGAAAYLGIGGNIPTPGDRVGVLNFYNIAMGGVDH